MKIYFVNQKTKGVLIMTNDMATAYDVRKFLHISPSTLKKLEETGELVPCMKRVTDGKRYYKWEDIHAYANSTLTDVDNNVYVKGE